MSADTLDLIVRALDARLVGRVHKAFCPLHLDQGSPNLEVSLGRNGRPLVICRVCGPERQRELLAAVETKGVPHWVWSHDVEPTARASNGTSNGAARAKAIQRWEYVVRDINGVAIATHWREDLDRADPRTGKLKRIGWKRAGENGLGGLSPDDLPLYGSELLRQFPKNGVVIVEGEKAAQALRDYGVKLALGTYGTSSKPSCDVLGLLVGRKRYILWPDNDEPGRKHMGYIAAKLVECGVDPELIQIVVWPEAPDKGDAADAGPARALELLNAAPYWKRDLVQLDDEPADPLPEVPAEVRKLRSLDIIWGNELNPTEIQWLWPGYLPKGRITLLQGDPGIGKSWLSLTIATTLSYGGHLPGEDPLTAPKRGARKTLFFAAEDDPNDTIAWRLASLGADATQIAIVRGTRNVKEDDTETTARFNFAHDVDVLDTILSEHHFDLVVFDPLNDYIGSNTDTHRDNDVRALLGPLHDVINRHKCACLALMHLTKGGRDKAVYRGQGSIAFGALARVILLAGKDPNSRPPSEGASRVAVVCIKNNLAPTPPSLAFDLEDGVVMWVPGGTETTAEDLLAPEPTREDRAALDDCKEAIVDMLQKDPQHRVEVNRLLATLHSGGHRDATIRRARKILTQEAILAEPDRDVFGNSGKWFLALVKRFE